MLRRLRRTATDRAQPDGISYRLSGASISHGFLVAWTDPYT